MERNTLKHIFLSLHTFTSLFPLFLPRDWFPLNQIPKLLTLPANGYIWLQHQDACDGKEEEGMRKQKEEALT